MEVQMSHELPPCLHAARVRTVGTRSRGAQWLTRTLRCLLCAGVQVPEEGTRSATGLGQAAATGSAGVESPAGGARTPNKRKREHERLGTRAKMANVGADDPAAAGGSTHSNALPWVPANYANLHNAAARNLIHGCDADITPFFVQDWQADGGQMLATHLSTFGIAVVDSHVADANAIIKDGDVGRTENVIRQKSEAVFRAGHTTKSCPIKYGPTRQRRMVSLASLSGRSGKEANGVREMHERLEQRIAPLVSVLKSAMLPYGSSLTLQHAALLGNVPVEPPTCDGPQELHMDLPVGARGCALFTPVDECMSLLVVPFSHGAARMLASNSSGVYDYMPDMYVTRLKIKRGQVAILDGNTVHSGDAPVAGKWSVRAFWYGLPKEVIITNQTTLLSQLPDEFQGKIHV